MKSSIVRIGLMVMAMMLTASTALALSFNTRPVAPGDNDLQDFFNSHVAGASYDAVADQHSAALFTATGTGSVTSFVFTATGGYNYGTGDQFGIYSPFSEMFVPIFNLSNIGDAAVPTATVNFADMDDDGSADDVFVTGASNAVIDTYYNFGTDIFGYYTAVGKDKYYTEDDKNGDLGAMALVYQGHGGTLSLDNNLANVTFDPNHWLIAFEAFSAPGTWKDFDDLIVVAESIAPVPEPGTLLLLGGGLLGLAYLRKRKKA